MSASTSISASDFLDAFGADDAAAKVKALLDTGVDLWSMYTPGLRIPVRLIYYALMERYYYEMPESIVWKSYLWDIYNRHFPFDSAFVYPDPPHRALSQRALTCGSDSVYTILFESKELRPYFYKDWDVSNSTTKCNLSTCDCELPTAKNLGVNITDYKNALTLAKARYDRMLSGGNKSVPLSVPRRNSISNNLWKIPHYTISKNEEDIYLITMKSFLSDLLDNKLLDHSIPNIQTSLYSQEHIGSTIKRTIDLDNVIGFIVLIEELTIKTIEMGHYIGFYKNDNVWYLFDTDVGYVHKIQDTEWFTSIFFPRLVYTINNPDKYEGDPEKQVYINVLRDPVKDAYLYSQFITLGARLYPNIKPVTTNTRFMIPTSLIMIENVPSMRRRGGGRRKTRRANRRV